MVRPTHTVNFFVVVLALLAVLMLTFPKNGIKLNDNLSLYFPDFNEWWNGGGFPSDSSNAYIPDMVAEDLGIEDTCLVAGAIDSTLLQNIEQFDSSVYSFVPRPIQVDQIRQPLELPEGGFQCLETLFKSLVNPDDLAKVVRIVHYGDSQIEADRISGYLRFKLQQQFGGSGPGLVPAKTAYDYKAPCAVENIGPWHRYTIFPIVDTAVKHSRYGVLAAFTRFSPLRKDPVNIGSATKKTDTPIPTQDADSLGVADSMSIAAVLDVEPAAPAVSREPETMYSGTLVFKPATFTHANVRQFRRVRMLYGSNQRPFNVKVRDGETLLYNDSLPVCNGGYASKTWNFPDTPAEFAMDFSGADSPDIYGFAMDGISGVAVDNVPLRGCSGTIFTRIEGATLAQMYRDLNVKCVILQFGGNAVPSIPAGSTASFRNYISAQIKYIKRIHPGVSIILIGPADMSHKVEGTDRFETYEVLPEMVNALKKAAFENGCAFWDMYAAMGGWNTMPDWVNHEPAYGEKDYVHFTANGANVMARMFYSALIARYNEYITKQ